MEKDKHTPSLEHSELPWKLTGDGFILNPKDDLIKISLREYRSAHGSAEETANAEYIIKACNNHYALLEALKEAKEIIRKLADQGRYPDFLLQKNGGKGIQFMTDAIKQAEE